MARAELEQAAAICYRVALEVGRLDHPKSIDWMTGLSGSGDAILEAVKGYSFILSKLKGKKNKAISMLKVMGNNNPQVYQKVNEIIAALRD